MISLGIIVASAVSAGVGAATGAPRGSRAVSGVIAAGIVLLVMVPVWAMVR